MTNDERPVAADAAAPAVTDGEPPAAADAVAPAVTDAARSSTNSWRMPRWVITAVVVFWLGFLATIVARSLWSTLSNLLILILLSIFLSLAIEPGVNRLSRRGWRRGTATITIVLGVAVAGLLFVVAIGALVGSQVAELLNNTEHYITDTVRFLNDTFGFNINADEAIESFNDPNGPVQQFIQDQQGNAVRLTVQALGWLLQLFSVLLFTFYLVADGPRLRRAICSRLVPEYQERVLAVWELAASKTGGYLYSRGLLALISAVFHWIVFQALGTAAPIPLALWVGVISQFMPVVGTYIAGVLPVLLTFLDSPLKALIVLTAIVLYQQIENYLLAPRITARTMELHPAVAFGSALGGTAVLGIVGALIALPLAAMVTALLSSLGTRYDVVDNDLVRVRPRKVHELPPRMRRTPKGVPIALDAGSGEVDESAGTPETDATDAAGDADHPAADRDAT